MKLTAFIIVCVVWLFILFLLKIKIDFAYCYNNLESNISIGLQVLFIKTKINLHISREMCTSGLLSLLNNLINDMLVKDTIDEKPLSSKNRKYILLKKVYKDTKRQYFFSWSKLKLLNKNFTRLTKDFFKKIHVYSLNIEIQIGTQDAACTGLLAGSISAICGILRARCYQLFAVKSNNIFFNVLPRFDAEMLFCRLHCILSLKISHIIFTAWKLLIIIIKNRRTRNYG
ncbi:MAG: DUF2953 domain-containing protein [Peptococcaceae bacterium]|nr:DUF2953 domain-containing protein [Peptococcaceae bacterium]